MRALPAGWWARGESRRAQGPPFSRFPCAGATAAAAVARTAAFGTRLISSKGDGRDRVAPIRTSTTVRLLDGELARLHHVAVEHHFHLVLARRPRLGIGD